MKKILFTLVAAAAALTFTNCQKDEIVMPESVSGQPFEIVASPETRTVNDGMSTKWADGDAVNVFHAEVSSKDYIPDGEFTLSDATTGTFTGTVSETLTENSSYDWYMFYPYSSYITTPANTDSGYMPVGCKSNATQAQTGIDNMSHIAGPNYPMAGKVEDVMGGEKPHITMTHLTALVRVNVTNNNAEDITVTSIKLTAAEDIVGTYYIDFSGDTPSFIGSGDNYVSSTATLDVTDGVVAAGKTAAFYLAIKPYVLENEDLIVTIAAEGYDAMEKTYTGLTTSFTAGKIKTINFAIETIEEATVKTISEIKESGTGEYVGIENATLIALGSKSGILEDATGRIFVYGSFITNYEVGNVLSLSEVTVGQYNNYLQITAATIEVTGTTEVDRGTPTIVAGTDMATYVSSFTPCDYIQIEASEISLGQYNNFYMEGYSKSASFVYPAFDLSIYNGLPARMKGYSCYVSSGYFYFLPVEMEFLPYLSIDSTGETFDASATTKTISISSENSAWTAASDAEWLTAVNTDGALVVSASENTSSSSRNATVTVTHATDSEITATITITQNGAGVVVTSDEINVTTWMSELGYTGTTGTLPSSLTYGDFTATFAKGSNTTSPGYNKDNSFRIYKGNTITISSDKTITNIIFTHSSTTYVGNNVYSDVGSYTVSGNTGTWTGSSNSVTFTNDDSANVQMRITCFKVTYAE